MRVMGYLLGLAGGALLIGLIVQQGAGQVALAVARAGWGIAAIIGLHALRLWSDTAGWIVLIPKEHRPRMAAGFWMHWIGESVSNLLPAARVGGDILTARFAVLRGVPGIIAAASMLVDVTTCVFTKIIFTVAGFLFLFAATGKTNLLWIGLVAELIAVLAITGFYLVQKAGVFKWTAALASRMAKSSNWRGLVDNGEALDNAVRELYAQRLRVAACGFLSMISWVIGAAEVWIGLNALGVRASILDGFILESASQGIRGALFLVPGALGVQEGGYLLVGNLLGIPGDISIALSVVLRVRELVFGIPGLIAWSIVEGRYLWKKQPIERKFGRELQNDLRKKPGSSSNKPIVWQRN
jgi:putative membrane protein